jgi:hypothetical protein
MYIFLDEFGHQAARDPEAGRESANEGGDPRPPHPSLLTSNLQPLPSDVMTITLSQPVTT